MSIAIDTACLECHLKRSLELVRPLGTEEQAMAFAKALMQLYQQVPDGAASPWFGPRMAKLLEEMYGLPADRMGQEKELSNRFVLERMPQIREKVFSAPDPVFAGLQFSILGNYLDFAALQGQVSLEALEDMLDKGLEMQLDPAVYARLCRDLETADVILAKGMGNTETMYGCGYNVYYAFLIKCQRFVKHFGHPMFTPLLVRDPEVG